MADERLQARIDRVAAEAEKRNMEFTAEEIERARVSYEQGRAKVLRAIGNGISASLSGIEYCPYPFDELRQKEPTWWETVVKTYGAKMPKPTE